MATYYTMWYEHTRTNQKYVSKRLLTSKQKEEEDKEREIYSEMLMFNSIVIHLEEYQKKYMYVHFLESVIK